MAFSIMGIFAVVLEVLRPVLPLFIGLVVVDLLLFGLSLRKRGAMRTGPRPGQLSLVLGAVGMVAAFIVLPGLTHSGFALLSGVLDYLTLGAAAVAAGVAVALIVYPPLRLLLR